MSAKQEALVLWIIQSLRAKDSQAERQGTLQVVQVERYNLTIGMSSNAQITCADRKKQTIAFFEVGQVLQLLNFPFLLPTMMQSNIPGLHQQVQSL